MKFSTMHQTMTCTIPMRSMDWIWGVSTEQLLITSLEKRWVRGDLIQVFRIVKGFDRINMEDFFELDYGGGYPLRGHRWKLKVKRSRLQLWRCFFSQRVINAWNKLPSYVVEAASVNSFKKRLDDWSMHGCGIISKRLTSTIITSHKLFTCPPKFWPIMCSGITSSSPMAKRPRELDQRFQVEGQFEAKL